MTLARGNSHSVPFQFSLRTMLLCVAGCAVLLSLLLSGKVVWVYWKGIPARHGRSQADADWAAHAARIYLP